MRKSTISTKKPNKPNMAQTGLTIDRKRMNGKSFANEAFFFHSYNKPKKKKNEISFP